MSPRAAAQAVERDPEPDYARRAVVDVPALVDLLQQFVRRIDGGLSFVPHDALRTVRHEPGVTRELQSRLAKLVNLPSRTKLLVHRARDGLVEQAQQAKP